MNERSRPSADTKDMMIAGCHVRLTYARTPAARWTVSATVRCGIGDKADERSLVTDTFDSRDAAERDALEQVTALLGKNTDRSNSRVRNWS
ncbi:MAG TPA: hypothetical protein VJL88_01695 [Nitrospira sp.]|nr:hypothetical protein [Nitrospira sp.]